MREKQQETDPGRASRFHWPFAPHFLDVCILFISLSRDTCLAPLFARMARWRRDKRLGPRVLVSTWRDGDMCVYLVCGYGLEPHTHSPQLPPSLQTPHPALTHASYLPRYLPTKRQECWGFRGFGIWGGRFLLFFYGRRTSPALFCLRPAKPTWGGGNRWKHTRQTGGPPPFCVPVGRTGETASPCSCEVWIVPDLLVTACVGGSWRPLGGACVPVMRSRCAEGEPLSDLALSEKKLGTQRGLTRQAVMVHKTGYGLAEEDAVVGLAYMQAYPDELACHQGP